MLLKQQNKINYLKINQPNLSAAESKPATCLLAFNKSRMPPAPPFTPWAASASSSVV